MSERTDQTEDWHILRGMNRAGPVSRAQLEELNRRGFFQAGDLLWSNCLGEWKPALDILGGIAHETPPPPPPQRNPSALPPLVALAAVVIISAAALIYYSGSNPAKLVSSTLSSVPTEAMARHAYEQRASRGGYEVVAFQKTNGMDTNILGTAIYKVEFKAVVSWPHGLNQQCKRPPPGMGVQCMGTTVLDPGARQSDQGYINFVKTENGWQPDD